ncbi:MAG TPA: glycosyltransferase family 2 protein [Terriglobia bacterium]|nr:glycosyltransferase family 2 protein [Terriglobia bacterium]
MSSAVAIINWNSGSWLRMCIESLLATTTTAEILIIDNASVDTSLESVEGFRNRVNVVRNSVNRGFAAAINQAFQLTSTLYVLVLNPDIRVMPGAVPVLEDFMNAHPRGGAVGGYVSGKYLPRDFPTVGSLVRENLGFPGSSTVTLPQQDEPFAVEQPAAAALMIRRDAWESIGGFDEQFYPAWYEDVDFCRRLTAAGWEIYFAPKAEFLHEGGYSARALGSENFLRAYYSNQLRYARKHFGSLGGAAVRASVAAGMIGRMIGRPKLASAYGKTLIGALKGW